MDGNPRPSSGSASSRTQSGFSKPEPSGEIVELILGSFYTDVSEAAQAIEFSSWMNVLSGIEPELLLAAWERYQKDGAKSAAGRLLKPTSYDLRQRAMRIKYEQGGFKTPQPGFTSIVDAQRRIEDKSHEGEPRIDKWTADQIVREAGYDPRRRQILERFPRARSIEEAEQLAEEKKRKEPHWSEVAAPDDPRWASLQKARDDNEIVKAARADYARMLKAKEEDDGRP